MTERRASAQRTPTGTGAAEGTSAEAAPPEARPLRLGFFTRLMEDEAAGGRYRHALEQIAYAEELGFETAWVAQHHFHRAEGGLPSPFVLLSAATQRTSSIRLGTAIVTLPMENPVRVAEDAAVLDLLSGGRVELGLGSGGNPRSFPAFGAEFAQRRELMAEKLAVLRGLLAGDAAAAGHALYPTVAELPGAASAAGSAAPPLAGRIWQATFSEGGGAHAGAGGDGLMLSRSQPRPEEHPEWDLLDLQGPVIAAYDAALPAGARRRVLASRTAFVTDAAHREEIIARTAAGLREEAPRLIGRTVEGLSDAEVLRVTNTFAGTAEEVADGLAAEQTLDPAAGLVTDVSFQVHSVPATHAETMRSLELLAGEVFPALGWR
ncbi:LLM class flavin-dependent oxidoreductase [Brevibacterium album]|uniref:LLM class flavin-dependent oxidoreductase n=1 Tax=Brevibacterium album TaxID=417948 RepID=UPI0009FEEE69|nr:LLM class flavin-dependent oxidoreductase [Brevibacterium album]